MKKHIITLALAIAGLAVMAQEKMYIHKADHFTLGALVTSTDSIYFSNDQSTILFSIGDTLDSYAVSEIDSITFGANSTIISIFYEGNYVRVINPLAYEGVSVSTDGANVTVTSTSQIQDIGYRLSGSTHGGSFKIYSQQPFELMLNGVQITNTNGPAINIQSGNTVTVDIMNGTTNALTDGGSYSNPAKAPDGKSEDQKGAFFSETTLIFTGTGNLTINGLGSAKHGLCSDSNIEINGCSINIASAAKDGIHAKTGFEMINGSLNITATGDAIDGDAGNVTITGGNITTLNDADDVKGITCDGTMSISGGVLMLTVNGDQSKAMKSESDITISGGSITIITTGDAVLEASGSGFDPSYCTAIKCDANINISGGSIDIISTGIAGKGISSDADITIANGTITITCSGNGARYTNTEGAYDAYVSTCITSDGNTLINGGNITTSSSGSGGKSISVDGTLNIENSNSPPVINLTTTGNRIYISGSGENAEYAEAKTVKSDGDIVIESGNITLNSADDGLKSETSITISTSIINITNSVEGIEAPFININSGEITIKSSDDCINTTFGLGGEQNDGSIMTFNGGFVAVNTTGGDGLDANGNIVINGGTIVVHGPPNAPEVGMDYNGSCNMNGGFLAVSGPNSNMLQAPSNSSTQNCLKAVTYSGLSASTLFHIQDASGVNILTFQPLRTYYSVIFSSSELLTGSTYSIYTGGSCNGTINNGLYTGGTYSGGTFRKSFTINNRITSVNF
ncbi:hypothetical protein TBC1_111435 [Lentimicrobium saccharophilum]|uniref:Carbohydrate-binding domain-containing protein n=1 Tax=Lentimicrobium saccharophilum TaxID=1678841 RepID=A0A0S7C0R4_9BACT|nr:carbohydrate-binding domain-containing protein [Lentimicrobium saccharophilum]GAP43284.1 hypothetical protein TBC1_111435 [Lentimicrobium saccharophilum]